MKKTIKLVTLLFIFAASSFSYAATVNLNTANKAELMTLKGVGEARADAIIKYRRATKFGSPSDVKNVPGIGEAIYKDNARTMKASGKTTAKPEVKSEAKSTKKDKAKSSSKTSKAKQKDKPEKKAKKKKAKKDTVKKKDKKAKKKKSKKKGKKTKKTKKK